jgi:glyoxylase-like metal-dependent hydrolase (beta-lactamase superfamily II)
MGNQCSNRQVPGVYRRRIGDILVTVLSDGYLDAGFHILQSIEPLDAEQILVESFRPPHPSISVNCFAVQAGGRTALVDTGSGASMGPTLGWLPANLAAAGIDPGDIDTVLLTHMHPDHSNGLADASGAAAFANAELVMHEAEVRHWTDDVQMSRANESQRTRYFLGARQQLKPYAERLRTFRQGEVFPGVTAMPIPGHTPGHTAYLIASGDDTMLIWGDIVHVPEIQLRRPEVTMVFDSDPEAAVAMRRRIFDMAATDRLLLSGMHLHFPGLSYMIERAGQYQLVPESWAFVA